MREQGQRRRRSLRVAQEEFGQARLEPEPRTGGGAFDDLETLSRGDRVVVRSRASELAYRVRSVEVLSREELARHRVDVFGRTGPARLVLITCEDWDGTAYRSNVVVTAQPVA